MELYFGKKFAAFFFNIAQQNRGPLKDYREGKIESITQTTRCERISHFAWLHFDTLEYVNWIKRERPENYDKTLKAKDWDCDRCFEDETITAHNVIDQALEDWENKSPIQKIEEMDNYSTLTLKQIGSQIHFSSFKN